MPDDWLDDLDKKKIEKEARYINRERYGDEGEDEEIIKEKKKLKDKSLEEIVKMGITDYDRGIVRGGVLVEEREQKEISVKCMPSYIYISFDEMKGKHKNLTNISACHRYVTKAGIPRFDTLNLKPYDKLNRVLIGLCHGMRDGYYVQLASNKVSYDFGATLSQKRTYRNYHWVDGDITDISDSYLIDKSLIDVIVCMLGLLSSDGTYVDDDVKHLIKEDINIFVNFINSRYYYLYNTILRIVGDMSPRHHLITKKCKYIKNISNFDNELYIKIVDILKKAGIEIDDSA